HVSLYVSHRHVTLSFFLLMLPPPPCSTLFPYTTLFRSLRVGGRLRHRKAYRRPGLFLEAEAIAGPVGERLLRHLQGDLAGRAQRSEEHTSELQSRENLVCRLLLEKKKNNRTYSFRKRNS